jgi:hypothetical protein
LTMVASGFFGDWEKAVAGKPAWKKKFPSGYHFVWELCAQFLHKNVAAEHREPIAMVFSRQNEYAKRAEEIWRAFRAGGLWPNLWSFTYGDPENFPHLQAADMLSYEIFQCLQNVSGEAFYADVKVQQKCREWPLMRQLFIERSKLKREFSFHTTKQFIEYMENLEKEGRIESFNKAMEERAKIKKQKKSKKKHS